MAIPRRATRVFRSLRAERRTLRQGLVALVLSTVAGFVAGLTLSGLGDTLQALPGLFILIPAAVGMRGTIFGAIGARLGTTNAAGTFEVSFRKDGVLYQNIYVAVVTTFGSALWLAVLAKVAASAFGEPSISIWSLVTISVVGGALGSVFILVVTVGLSILSYRRGWDLDSVSTPMVTALGDMATLPTLYLATFLVRNATVNAVVSAICVAAALYAALRAYTVGAPVVRRVILEMMAVILLTPVLDILSGVLQEHRLPELAAVPVVDHRRWDSSWSHPAWAPTTAAWLTRAAAVTRPRPTSPTPRTGSASSRPTSSRSRRRPPPRRRTLMGCGLGAGGGRAPVDQRGLTRATRYADPDINTQARADALSRYATQGSQDAIDAFAAAAEDLEAAQAAHRRDEADAPARRHRGARRAPRRTRAGVRPPRGARDASARRPSGGAGPTGTPPAAAAASLLVHLVGILARRPRPPLVIPSAPSDPVASAPVGGIVCPVQGPVAFSDTWGACRAGGRAHKGVDMLSPMGTPTVAPVSGTVSHRGNSLGGLSWHLDGDNGSLLLRHPPVGVRQPGCRPRGSRHRHRLRRRLRQRSRHPPPPLRDPPGRWAAVNPYPAVRCRLLALVPACGGSSSQRR